MSRISGDDDLSGGWCLGVTRHSRVADVPDLVLGELRAARRGVVLLAVDGLALRPARSAWPAARITAMTTTFPSTSATAWLTALTGTPASVHGTAGMVYRAGDSLVYAVTGAVLAGDPEPARPVVLPQPTVFERAAAAGVRCLAIGRELDGLAGPWAPALLRGAERVDGTAPDALAAQAADPLRLAAGVVAGVDRVLGDVRGRGRVLLWVYVNLDDHVHANGYDAAALAGLRRLERAAVRWAGDGWTVLAHSDHGQVPVRPDPALADAWAEVDDPADCELPAGGAGRVRWLYPRPGREERVRRRLAAALGDAAVVRGAAKLGLRAGRVGAVVAVAASERFPVPVPHVRYEHGGLHVDEVVIPLAAWWPRPR